MPKKRPANQIAQHRGRIVELRLKGWSQAEIALELGLSQPTVARDLKTIEEEMHREMLRDTGNFKARELARLAELERQAWEGWEASKTGHYAEEVVLDGDAPNRAASRKLRPRRYRARTDTGHGDVRYMKLILRISDRRCKLLGLSAPIKGLLPTEDEDVSAMTIKERARQCLEILILCGPLLSAEGSAPGNSSA